MSIGEATQQVWSHYPWTDCHNPHHIHQADQVPCICMSWLHPLAQYPSICHYSSYDLYHQID
jgi:hypothetical protein